MLRALIFDFDALIVDTESRGSDHVPGSWSWTAWG